MNNLPKKALQIILHFRDNSDPLTVTQMAKRFCMSADTVYRSMAAIENEGYYFCRRKKGNVTWITFPVSQLLHNRRDSGNWLVDAQIARKSRGFMSAPESHSILASQ